MKRFQPADIGFALVRHLQERLAGLAVRKGCGKPAALFDPVPHSGDHLQILVRHAGGNSFGLNPFPGLSV